MSGLHEPRLPGDYLERAIVEGRHKVQIDQSLCIGCTLCAQVCTVDCIKTAAPVMQ